MRALLITICLTIAMLVTAVAAQSPNPPTCKDIPDVCDMKLARQAQELDRKETDLAYVLTQRNALQVERDGLKKRIEELDGQIKAAAAQAAAASRESKDAAAPLSSENR